MGQAERMMYREGSAQQRTNPGAPRMPAAVNSRSGWIREVSTSSTVSAVTAYDNQPQAAESAATQPPAR